MESGELELLFEESFHGTHPADDARAASEQAPWGPDHADVHNLAQAVLDHLDVIPEYAPKRYYLARARGASIHDAPSFNDNALADAQEDLERLSSDLAFRGYFTWAAGSDCPDEVSDESVSSAMSRLLSRAAEFEVRWPLRLVSNGSGIDQDEFFTILEVLHDLVARPRARYLHRFPEDHYDYGQCEERFGQAVFRAHVNHLLSRHNLPFAMSSQQEDRGQVVAAPIDPRRELIDAATTAVPDENTDPIAHAITLFRNRNASIEDKRSACRALAAVLEDRRTILKAQLLSNDEQALFQIANQFGIRHHKADQHTDYAPHQFLDWIFWNYLATVELSNRLIRRASEATP